MDQDDAPVIQAFQGRPIPADRVLIAFTQRSLAQTFIIDPIFQRLSVRALGDTAFSPDNPGS